MNKRKKLIGILTIFILLSIIKFFTAKVGLLGDPTVYLVIKPNPTISNSFMMKGLETRTEKYEGTWYYEGKYKVITGDEMGFSGEALYDLLIVAWWFLGIGIVIYIVVIKVKTIRNLRIK